MSDERRLEFEIEVEGAPDEVWRAVATGPGVSSWYVPHTIEERAGGVAIASFGPGPEMQVNGRVLAWEPPARVVFDGGDGVPGLAFEWLVEPRGSGSCLVRLVNSGFGDGEEWDAQYDGMAYGWQLFLLNLKLHLEHFRGQVATSMLPTATWSGPRDRAWTHLLGALGVSADVVAGARVEIDLPDAPPLAGTVADVAPWRIATVLDEPAPGTAFLTAEGNGDQISVSIWSYLYGSAGAAAAARDAQRWQQWLENNSMPTTTGIDNK